MSTSQNNIRLKQASYQIRGEVISTLAEAGLLCLMGFINAAIPQESSCNRALISTDKHTGLTNVNSYGHACRANRLKSISNVGSNRFSLYR